MRDIKPLHIASIVKPAGFGGTKPIIIKASDDKLYVLKTRDDGTNPKDLGVFNEILAYMIHDFMGFKISPQNICYLYISDDVIKMAYDASVQNVIERESYELIKNSSGFNVGIEYMENAMEITNNKIGNRFIKDTIRLDNYILNCDRVENSNPNILQDKNDRRKFYAIDYGNALADAILYEKIVDGDMVESLNEMECNLVKSSGRYMFRNHDVFMSYKVTSDSLDILEIFLLDAMESMPSDWEPLNYKVQLSKIIAIRIKSRKIFDTVSFTKCECLY